MMGLVYDKKKQFHLQWAIPKVLSLWIVIKITYFATVTEGYTQEEPYFHMEDSDIKNVNVSLNIVSFLKVDELGQTIKVVFEIDRTWFDSQLVFLHLQEDSDFNTLWKRSHGRLWYPKIFFENIEPSKSYRERYLRYKILRNMKVAPIVHNPGTTDGMNVFKGSDHEVVRSQEYTYYWRCVFNLEWYPFDRQTCRMRFNVLKHHRNRVKLNPMGLSYQGNGEELTEYSVDKLLLCSKPNGTQLVFEVTLGRPLIGSVLTIYIPTLLLLVIR